MGIRKLSSKRRGEAAAVAVAVNKDQGSQHALKWAVDHFLKHGQTITLLHVKQPADADVQTGCMALNSDVTEEAGEVYKSQGDAQAKEWMRPMRGFCTKKAISCNEVIVEDSHISKALINYVTENSIEVLVLGVPSKNGIFRFKAKDVPSAMLKGAPDFCTVYVIDREKISSVRYATGELPPKPEELSSPCEQKELHLQSASEGNQSPPCSSRSCAISLESSSTKVNMRNESCELLPSNRKSAMSGKKPSLDRMFAFSDNMAAGVTPSHSTSSELDRSSTSTSYSGIEFIDMSSPRNDFSLSSFGNGRSSTSKNREEMDAELKMLRLKLKQTMDMYSMACKEAVTEKQKAKELNRWKLEKGHKFEEARLAEEMALQLVEIEKEKCKAAIEAADAAKRVAELEAQKTKFAEMKALRQEMEEKKVIKAMSYGVRYRKYTIEELEAATYDFSRSRKIGEGGYGPVYRGELDHTQVAIKVLRPDAAQGRLQFQKEVEVLSSIRHPNLVLLLGACPEYGCLVYEYMANGSLEDCLFQRRNAPAIPWQLRFRIAADICTGIVFLHRTKPEPLVHRDLKPGNILLDHNYVSKISDVGLARLVPPSVADTVTQYRMTSTAGTFCYIDPEYQQTGMLGTKSDIYSLGVILLQLITAKPPMGLTYHVEEAIEMGNFAQILDPAVPDWPVEEALTFAKLALQCAEMRRKDRPDLGEVVLPALNRLSAFAQDSIKYFSTQDVLNDLHLSQSSRSSRSNYTERSHSQL